MGLLKTQPAFDYYQPMFRAVFSYLVGLILSLSGGAHALTFKSDGSVIQNDGTVVQSPNDSVAAKAAKKAKAEAQATKTETISNNQQIVNNTPDWCLNLPQSNLAIYRCGIGESNNLNMARNRATLDAKRALADQIDSEISSRMEDFLQSSGTGANEQIRQRSEVITKNVTVAAKLTGYKEVYSESQSVGTQFIHYVLIGYPIAVANEDLLNQIKEDEVLSTTEAADAAIADLEAEILKKVSGS